MNIFEELKEFSKDDILKVADLIRKHDPLSDNSNRKLAELINETERLGIPVRIVVLLRRLDYINPRFDLNSWFRESDVDGQD